MKIVHQDEWLLAVDKPAGLPVLPTPNGEEKTLATKITRQFPEQKKIPDCGIVHRLDNDTSGIVLIARSVEIYETLRELWNTEAVKKMYLAIVLGKLKGDGDITTPIAHHPSKKKKMVPAGKSGRTAITHWKSKKVIGDYTLLEVSITTGVRHQIRIHLASIGHPLAGDSLYQKTKHHTQNPRGLTHHLLHLSQLVFPHPAKANVNLVLQSDPPFPSLG